jgi:Uma2 family endonuclease
MQSLEAKALLVDTNRITLRVNSTEFEQICQDNPELRLELKADGELVTMAPVGYESSEKNGDLFGYIWSWNLQAKQGRIIVKI